MKPHSTSGDDLSLDHKTTIPRSLAILGAVFLVMLLNGCASLGGSGNQDPWQYNANTGYPAVGGPIPSWGRF